MVKISIKMVIIITVGIIICIIMTSLTDKKIFIARIKLETMWGHFQENNGPSFI